MDRQIIVCDDESHVVRVIALKFMRAGFDVMGASNIHSCWKLLHAPESTELLIIGDSLPTMDDTIQFIRKVRCEQRLARLPILLLTSNSIETVAEHHELSELKIADIVAKPFSPRELLDKVCNLVGHRPRMELAPKFIERSRNSIASN